VCACWRYSWMRCRPTTTGPMTIVWKMAMMVGTFFIIYASHNQCSARTKNVLPKTRKMKTMHVFKQCTSMERLICLIGLFFSSLSSNGMSFCTKDKSSCTKSRSLSTFKRLLWLNSKSSCTFWGCPAENIYRY